MQNPGGGAPFAPFPGYPGGAPLPMPPSVAGAGTPKGPTAAGYSPQQLQQMQMQRSFQQAQSQQQRMSASQQQMQHLQMQFMAQHQAAAVQQAQAARLGSPSPRAGAASQAVAATAATQQALSPSSAKRRPPSLSPGAEVAHQPSGEGKMTQPLSAAPRPKASRSASERSVGQPTTSSTPNASAPTKGGGGSNDHSSLSPEEVRSLLSQCTWEERLIFAARQLLGGNAVNGFVRGTAAAQRMKKQRGRQAATARAKRVERAEAALAAAAGTDKAAAAAAAAEEAKKKNQEAEEELKTQDEEGLKRDTLNAKTARRIKTELQASRDFCDTLAATFQSILDEMGGEDEEESAQDDGVAGPIGSGVKLQDTTVQDPDGAMQQHGDIPLGTPSNPSVMGLGQNELTEKMQKQAASSQVTKGDTAEKEKQQQQQQQQQPVKPAQGPGTDHNPHAETVAAGNPNGSTLRRSRKRPPGHKEPTDPTAGLSKEDAALLNAFDESGRRRLTKKEVAYRSFEITRFRTLRVGDYVAARVASHELWILARVVREWKALDLSHSELMSMTESKRDTLFKEKVYIQDIEEYNGDVRQAKAVARQLVLPLPRTYEEAAVWCTRCKKGTRCYAMYPETTSLYCATAVDNTTYCRGEDDIVVVEFDGDEDDTNNVPQHHIPARFVTLIPREFPAAQVNRKKRRSTCVPSAAQTATNTKLLVHSQTQQESSAPSASSRKGSIMAPTARSKGSRSAEGKAPGGVTGGVDVQGGELDDMISDMAKGNFDASVDLETFGSFDFEDDFLGDVQAPVTKKKKKKTGTTPTPFAAANAAAGTKTKQSKKSGSKQQSKKTGEDAPASGSTKKGKGIGTSSKRRSSSKKSSDGGKKRASDPVADKATHKKTKK